MQTLTKRKLDGSIKSDKTDVKARKDTRDKKDIA